MKVLAIAVAMSTLLMSAVSIRAQDSTLVVRDAWIRQPAPNKTEAALYLELENRSPERRAIVAASSDIASSAEMHEMKMEKMVMTMTFVSQIAVPAKGKATLDPNRFHIMLYGLKSRPAIGASIAVTLKMDDGTSVPVTAVVRK